MINFAGEIELAICAALHASSPTRSLPQRGSQSPPPARRIMTTSTLPVPTATRSRFKSVLWICLGLTTLFVFITSEVLLVTDYPMYHAYRLQVISDRNLLIPHMLAGIFALLIGPINFSSRIRQHHLQLHRVLGRIYVISVFIGSFTA